MLAPKTIFLRSLKIISIGVLLAATSCAPRPNKLRNMAGPILPSSDYQGFENFENEETGDFPPPPPTSKPQDRNPKKQQPAEIRTQPQTEAPESPATEPEPRPARPAPVSQFEKWPEKPRENPSTTSEGTPIESVQPAPKAPADPVNGNCLESESPCFPVAGKVWFMDTFGAARGGHRKHAGNDIFAEKLTPIVAVEDGVIDIVKSGGGLSGTYIGINHGNGMRSLYMHLNNDSPGTNDGQGHGILPGLKRGMHVKKGQHLGWVGNSGNAESTPSHLHFELRVSENKRSIRIRDFYPVNPFKFLKDAEPAKLTLPMALNY